MSIDVLIIGAGPAGCAAAISARHAGLSTMLMEARADAHKAPGETLHPGVEPILRKLGVWQEVISAGFLRHRGIWREMNGSRNFEPYGSDSTGEWLGFQADRRTLHGILQCAAREAGAVFKRSMIPSAVILQDGRVGGVICKESEIRSRWVFDATGRHAWLPRMLGLRKDCAGPALQVRFGWTNDNDRFLNGQPLFRQHMRGWEWYAPLGDGRTAWTRLEQTARDHKTGPRWGIDMTWRLHHPCAGPGYFLLGDAAALLDPAASNGVLRALMSGMLATDFSARVLRGTNENSAIQAYIHWTSGMFYHQANSLGELYLPAQKKA